MLTYKGIPQDEIAISIDNARAFAASLDLDPVITQHLAQITDSAVDDIRNASTREDLVAAVENVRITYLFAADLFMAHGMVDTNGEGASVARDLYSWGAFSGARHLALTQTDVAIENHLRALTPPTNAQADAFFNALPASYIGRYAIICDTNDRADIDAKVETLRDVLEPFWAKGDSGSMRIMIGGLNHLDPRRFSGLVFETSREAARAVAAAFPNDVIRDVNGDEVKADEAPATRTQRPQITPRLPRAFRP